MQDAELVTVVVPAHDEERFLGACLDSVRAQDYTALQIVVVDNASTDGTVDVIRAAMAADDRVELLQNPRRSIPSSLNLALSAARGRWLVRVDAHSTVGPGYVRAAVERLRQGEWGGVGGRKDGVGSTPAGRAIAVAMSSRLGVGGSTYHYGTEVTEVDHIPFGAYPTDLVRQLGGWDETLTANEDYEFDYRLRKAGHRLLFDPQLVIRWHCRQSIPDLFRQYYRYGKGKVDVLRRHPRSMQPRHAAPPALLVYAALGLLLAARRPAGSAAMLAPYAAALAVESARCGRRLSGTGERARVPGAFLAMHLGWGAGFWAGLLTSRPQPRGAGGRSPGGSADHR